LFWRSLAALSLTAAAVGAATRPRYGGTLRIETSLSIETLDPPAAGDLGPARRLAGLAGPFRIVRWEPGRRAVYAADDSSGGRPFVDAVEVQLGRPRREQLVDLEVGKADMVEFAPGGARRAAAARRVWASAPVKLLAVVDDGGRVDATVRQALALAIDRAAIHAVLLERQGEVAGGILPRWLSGYGFVFETARDVQRARALAAGARPLSLSYDPGEPQARAIAERIALNARDAGLAVQVAPQNPRAELRLAYADIVSEDSGLALSLAAAALGLAAPPRADSPEALYQAEKALLEGARVIPLVHLPESWSVAPRVRTWRGPAVDRLGAWRLENVWLEPDKP
jgi:ABC-type transport system substrate-binding protein